MEKRFGSLKSSVCVRFDNCRLCLKDQRAHSHLDSICNADAKLQESWCLVITSTCLFIFIYITNLATLPPYFSSLHTHFTFFVWTEQAELPILQVLRHLGTEHPLLND